MAEVDALGKRFRAVWQRCANDAGACNASELWDRVRDHYCEPHRRYHTLDHIGHCLDEFDRAAHLIDESNAAEMALWFHDVIYELGAPDNEARSALFFNDAAHCCMDAGFVTRVKDLILATTHKALTDDVGCRYVVDIDLSSLGQPWREFLANSHAIRDEQQLSASAETEFLRALLQRERIYQTDFFHERLEARARRNIERYCEQV